MVKNRRDIPFGMKKSPASKRLKALKITNTALGRRLGVHNSTVSQALTSENQRYIGLLDALEMLTPEQRKQWLDEDD
jgi:hypothetical protein